MTRTTKYCFAWYMPRSANQGTDRAALRRASKWSTGDIIEISFLDGDPMLHERVKAAAKLWTAPGMANLRFVFRKDTTKTDIRISFQPGGSWSLIGTDCRLLDTTMPTMNLGWLTPESPEDELRGVVLHEFGHALGLIHEHQSPAQGIQWNKEQVYKDLSGPPNNWDKATVDANLFAPFNAAATNFTALDATSIMMYEIPAEWTLNGFSASINEQLSSADIDFVRKEYP